MVRLLLTCVIQVLMALTVNNGTAYIGKYQSLLIDGAFNWEG